MTHEEIKRFLSEEEPDKTKEALKYAMDSLYYSFRLIDNFLELLNQQSEKTGDEYMGEFDLEKTCKTCNHVLHTRCKEPCDSCLCTYSNWECPDWLKDWFSSFDASSATQCFTAVNQLKERLEVENKNE